LKSKSPSCGLENVPIHEANGEIVKSGTGLFAQALLEGYDGLPIVEEKTLEDPPSRVAFIEKVIAYRKRRVIAMRAAVLRRYV
jgi:hypothetical protein